MIQPQRQLHLNLFILSTGHHEASWRHPEAMPQMEAFTLLSAIAAVTERIGLTATASTTYNEPYHIARKFASLDHISGGRAGWNIVTSTGDATARNFSRNEHMGHRERYERGREFVEVVKRLWDSWGEGSLVIDKETGIYANMDRIHGADYQGYHFSVQGALNIPRSPQSYPVLVQAGSSEAARNLLPSSPK